LLLQTLLERRLISAFQSIVWASNSASIDALRLLRPAEAGLPDDLEPAGRASDGKPRR
jgi:hypothetical protein